MKIFCDTSFLCSFYGKDSHTPQATQFVRQRVPVIWISALLDFEFTCGVQRRLFQKNISVKGAEVMLDDYALDIQSGTLVMPPCEMPEVIKLAKQLALTRTATHGHRSFDILHVATALHLGADEFLTFDANQRRLVENAGLAVPL